MVHKNFTCCMLQPCLPALRNMLNVSCSLHHAQKRTHGNASSPPRTHRFADDVLQHFYVRIFYQRGRYRQPLRARAYTVEGTCSSIRSKEDKGQHWRETVPGDHRKREATTTEDLCSSCPPRLRRPYPTVFPRHPCACGPSAQRSKDARARSVNLIYPIKPQILKKTSQKIQISALGTSGPGPAGFAAYEVRCGCRVQWRVRSLKALITLQSP